MSNIFEGFLSTPEVNEAFGAQALTVMRELPVIMKNSVVAGFSQ